MSKPIQWGQPPLRSGYRWPTPKERAPMRLNRMPKAYLIMLELESGNAETHKVPMFSHAFATREQAEQQIEASAEAGDFERWRMSIQGFPIVPATESAT